MIFQLMASKPIINQLHTALSKYRQKGDLKTVCRITSVLSILSGYTALETAEIMQLPVKTIYDWVKKFLLGGVGALINKKKAGRPSKLTKNQRRQLSKLIDNGPEKSGFSGSCWRSPMIQELIHRTFKIFYSARYISELLKNMGFSYQKARFVAGKQDELAREQWIKSTWKSILEAARKKPSYILFGDEVSFPQWGTLSYTWARKGQQPVIKTSGTRRAYKVFGLIDYFTGKLFSKGHEGRFNAESYIDFLQEVLSMTRKPIFLIQDGAPYHKGKKVKAFFEKHKNRLTVHTLPSYSPDFNPIEGLWKKIKDQGTHLKYFLTFDSLIDKVEEMLITFECASDEILKLFGFYEKI